MDTRYEQERCVFNVAEEERQQLCHVNVSWWGFLYLAYRGMIPWLVNGLTTFANSHKKMVIPAFRTHEATACSDLPKQQQHRQGWNHCCWTLANVAGNGISIPDAQAWLQLKLHRFLTDDDNVCGLVPPEELNHFFIGCRARRQIFPPALLLASPETISSVGSLLPDVLDFGRACKDCSSWSAPQSTRALSLNSGKKQKS